MGRLFWKFLLAFWVALLSAGIGVGVVVWLHKPTETEGASRLANDPRADFIVRLASGALRSGGEESLRRLLEPLGDTGPATLYAVNERGEDILGRPVPGDTLVMALTAKTHMSVGAVDLGPGRNWRVFMPSSPRPGFGLGPGGPPHMPPPPGSGPGPGRPPPGLWLPILMGVLASLGFSALLAWYFFKPIRELRQAFHAVAAGKLETRVESGMGGRRDELADLGHDFDTMAAQIDQLIGAQRRLFHDVSHELRSPLARLQAAIGLVRQNPDKLEAMLGRLELESGRLDELVGEILTLARLESGVSGVRVETFDAMALLEGIADDAQFEAESAGCLLDYRGSGAAWVQGQSDWLGRAFENVIRNAIRHTQPDTRVEVEAATDSSGMLSVIVEDRGRGVLDDELEAIFQPFYRGRQSHACTGFGLGLAIARRAVLAHGGRIQALNRVGGGLRMQIELPLGRPPTD